MVDLIDFAPKFDQFSDGNETVDTKPLVKDYVHIRLQQRNGKKTLTTVQGIPKQFKYDKILKDLKKSFFCNGNIVNDKELGEVIQLQGDQRKSTHDFLVKSGIAPKDLVKLHGF